MVPAPQASRAVSPSDLLVPSPFILTLCLLVTALFSAICKLFALFASFFARAILCFQHLTNSFCKNTGGGGTPTLVGPSRQPSFPRQRRASGGDPQPLCGIIYLTQGHIYC